MAGRDPLDGPCRCGDPGCPSCGEGGSSSNEMPESQEDEWFRRGQEAAGRWNETGKVSTFSTSERGEWLKAKDHAQLDELSDGVLLRYSYEDGWNARMEDYRDTRFTIQAAKISEEVTIAYGVDEADIRVQYREDPDPAHWDWEQIENDWIPLEGQHTGPVAIMRARRAAAARSAARRRRPGNTRQFGGMIYGYQGSVRVAGSNVKGGVRGTKQQARATAAYYRAAGWNARVVPIMGGYAIYTRRRSGAVLVTPPGEPRP